MNFLNSFNNAIDKFFDYIDSYNAMSPDYAAFVIQTAYRRHLVRKYFKLLKHCPPEPESNISSGWFS